MGRPRRKAKQSSKDDEATASNSDATSKPTGETVFDPKKLSIVINGESKPFSTWTREYARHYYPNLGQRTYRVPPVDFNTQELREVTRLGFSELRGQKEENRKKDRSQADVAFMMEELGRRLEATSGGGGGLFIIANAHYDNYLSDLKGVKIKGQQPPLPKEVASRGEVDLLVLHRQKGILLVQVKGVGLTTGTWQPTEQEIQQAVRKKVKGALEQVERDHVVLDHVMKDLQLQCAVHGVVALPFVSHTLLQQTFKGTEEGGDRRGTQFLCMEDLVSVDAILEWWEKLESRDDLSDDQLQSIVGRYCGLLSTVQVWAKSSLRVEVRDVAEAASEVGTRFASIVLTPEQRAVLDCQAKYAYLYGPPGSGKSVMLVVKARQWVLMDNDICILNLDLGKDGMPIGHYIHDSILQWALMKLNGGSKEERSKRDVKNTNAAYSSGINSSSKELVTSDQDSGVSSASTDVSTTSASEESDHAAGNLDMDGGDVESDGVGSTETSSGYPGSAKSQPSINNCRSPAAPNSRIFRVDFNLDKKDALEDVLEIIRKQIRPGVPCHFLCDEFYMKERLVPVIKAIQREFPDSCIWCAEISGKGAPEDFVLMPLKTVLRCPPTVQAVLQRLDWSDENRSLYTVDSTHHGLPTDGLKPRLLEHKHHVADSPLDCPECADLFLEFLRQDLKLTWHKKGGERDGENENPEEIASTSCDVASCTDRISSGGNPEDALGKSGIMAENKDSTTGKGKEISRKGKSATTREKSVGSSVLPVPKTKKKGHLIPRRVKFSDVVVLFAYPRKCLKPGTDLLLVKAQLQDLHHAAIQNSVFYRRVVEAGVPSTFLAPNADARDIALPAQDQVMFSVTNAVTGLERKVVVYIPCESTAFPDYPLHVACTATAVGKRKFEEVATNVNDEQQQLQTEDSPLPRENSQGNHVPESPSSMEVNQQPKESLQTDSQESGKELLHKEKIRKSIAQSGITDFQGDVLTEAEIPDNGDVKLMTPCLNSLEGKDGVHNDKRSLLSNNFTVTGKAADRAETEISESDQSNTSRAPPTSTTTRTAANPPAATSNLPLGKQTDASAQPSQFPPCSEDTSADLTLDQNSCDTNSPSKDTGDTGACPRHPVQRWKAGLSEDDWAKIDERMLQQNKFGMFYAASRCLSVFVLVIP